jgi:hypothetical protein
MKAHEGSLQAHLDTTSLKLLWEPPEGCYIGHGYFIWNMMDSPVFLPDVLVLVSTDGALVISSRNFWIALCDSILYCI